MGFLDKAKQKLKSVSGNLGEETVRVVNYDDEPEAKTAAPAMDTRFSPDPIEEIIPTLPKAVDINNKHSLFGSKKKKTDSVDSVVSDLARMDNNKIKDVLEVLTIPETFEIDSNIFLPEDIQSINFDLQAPSGFDQGQVNAFKEQVKISLSYLVKLLRLRNEHVAKLATAVDRLQTDVQNQRFEAEVANGINIMPTEDDASLSNQAMEDALLIRRLLDENNELKTGDGLSSAEREAYDSLQDELSLVKRELEEKVEIIQELKARLAYADEDGAIDFVEEDNGGFTFDSADEKIVPVTQFGGHSISDEDNGNGLPDELPELGNMEELPTYDDAKDPFASSAKASSAFYDEEEGSLEDFVESNAQAYAGDQNESASSVIEYMDDDDPPVFANPGSAIRYDEDEYDPLEAIMNEEWGKDKK